MQQHPCGGGVVGGEAEAALPDLEIGGGGGDDCVKAGGDDGVGTGTGGGDHPGGRFHGV